MMQTVAKAAFKVIGIAVETTNKNMQAVQDIGALWQRFSAEDIFNKIPGKLSQEIYEVFTNYTGRYTDPYLTIIGCMVEASAVAPDGMVAKNIPAQTYHIYLAEGKMPEAVGATWGQIWQNDAQLNRAYVADFDVYGPQAHDPNHPVVEIFLGVQ